jgi:hypothetical protein
MNVVAHPSIIEIPQMQPQHHYVESFRSWTKIKNKASKKDRLHLIVSFYSKIPRAPTISQVLFFHNGPHYTFTLRPPKIVKDDDCHYNHS